ncbi:MAG: tetratricopeptide repeat protein, partial [Caldilinea sp.]|nr:tetratricopeptide repeat protein [Caldilinea sp.]
MGLLADEDESQDEQLARHYLQTDNHAEAVRWLMRSGAKARHSFLNDQACRYFELALERCELLDPGETATEWRDARADIWLQLGRTYFSNGEYPDAENAFRKARELGEGAGWTTGRLIDLTYWLGEALFWQGKLDAVEVEASRALEHTGDDETSLSSALMLSHLAVANYSTARYSAFATIIERLEPIILALPFTEVLSPAFDHVINHHMIHEKAPESTRMWIDTLAARATANRDLNSLAKATLADSTLHFNCGDMEKSRDLAKHALDI